MLLQIVAIALKAGLGPTRDWDTAAAHTVVTQASGAVCDLSDHDLHYPEFLVIPAEDRTLQVAHRANLQDFSL